MHLQITSVVEAPPMPIAISPDLRLNPQAVTNSQSLATLVLIEVSLQFLSALHQHDIHRYGLPLLYRFREHHCLVSHLPLRPLHP